MGKKLHMFGAILMFIFIILGIVYGNDTSLYFSVFAFIPNVYGYLSAKEVI